MAKHWRAAAVLLCAVLSADGFYLPGVAPTEYAAGDAVEIKTQKLTSVKRPLPFEYYALPFCKPLNMKHTKLNLGEVLRGDRIMTTPYELQMETNRSCVRLCKGPKGEEPVLKHYTKKQVAKFEKFIRHQYRVHWLMDNLPSATKMSLTDGSQRYSHGFPVGFVDKALNNVYLFNHVIISGKVHKVEEDKHRVVGFEIKTRSINANRYTNTSNMGCKVKPSTTENNDKSGALILNSANMQEDELLTVQWSYSVNWEPSEIAWASRWDTYLQMDDAEIHWFSIINSLVTVLFLSGIIAFIMIRTLSRDIAKYNEEEEKDELFEQRGWKLVHGDVFRAPNRMGTLCVAAGSGIQLFCMVFVTILFSMLGMLSPANRGSLMTTAVFLYMFAGLFSGYFSGRLYRSMGGEDWMKQAVYTGLLFPAVTFGTGFVLNFFIWYQGSSGALPFTTMLALLFLWLGLSLPLVVGGAYFGFRKDAFDFPVNVNQIPRQIPEQLWYMHPIVSVLLGGILPFGAIFIELFFILTAIWENQFYYLFGFLMLVFLILIISCSEIAIVMTYLQLCSEDYHWWWRSYLVSGGCAVYVFLYAIFYFVTKLEIEEPLAALIYFSYTAIMALAFWFTTGTIGFLATFGFVWKIYGSVKID